VNMHGDGEASMANDSVQILDSHAASISKDGMAFSMLPSQNSGLASPSSNLISGQVSLRNSNGGLYIGASASGFTSGHGTTEQHAVSRKQELPKFGYEKVVLHADSMLQPDQSF